MIAGVPPLLFNGFLRQLDDRLTRQYPYRFVPHHPSLHQPSRRPADTEKSLMQRIRATADFRYNSLPLARIKRIMKSDREVKMIAAETPSLFSRACEMFILDLTHLSWLQTECGKRQTMQRSHVAAAISKSEMLDFLAGIITVDGTEEAPAPAPLPAPAPVGEELIESIPPHLCEDHPNFGSLMMDMGHVEQHHGGAGRDMKWR
ncbi:Nuclear transcription factor Y subunit C-2 [Platanthera guangdongensis]|uniref:Nuclear transcription factor Y subunit C-2 n=1 Tax=Platanthera guangdongensis TaxID=2320717 RepID=A0ABR2MAI6_9ASPA